MLFFFIRKRIKTLTVPTFRHRGARGTSLRSGSSGLDIRAVSRTRDQFHVFLLGHRAKTKHYILGSHKQRLAKELIVLWKAAPKGATIVHHLLLTIYSTIIVANQSHTVALEYCACRP